MDVSPLPHATCRSISVLAGLASRKVHDWELPHLSEGAQSGARFCTLHALPILRATRRPRALGARTRTAARNSPRPASVQPDDPASASVGAHAHAQPVDPGG